MAVKSIIFDGSVGSGGSCISSSVIPIPKNAPFSGTFAYKPKLPSFFLIAMYPVPYNTYPDPSTSVSFLLLLSDGISLTYVGTNTLKSNFPSQFISPSGCPCSIFPVAQISFTLFIPFPISNTSSGYFLFTKLYLSIAEYITFISLILSKFLPLANCFSGLIRYIAIPNTNPINTIVINISIIVNPFFSVLFIIFLIIIYYLILYHIFFNFKI